MLERRGVGVLALAPDEEIGIESGFEREHADIEFCSTAGRECARGAAPAVSGSKLTTTFFEKRPSNFAWISVNAVPELAITLWKPAA